MRYAVSFAVVFGAVAVVGCADATGPARQVLSPARTSAANIDKVVNVNTSTRMREMLALDAIVACNGEQVRGTDEETTETHAELNADGHVHSVVRIHDTIRGAGSVTGAQLTGSMETRIDLSQTKNISMRIQMESVLLRQGKSPDTRVRIDTDVHLDASGRITKSKNVFTATCD